MNICLPLKESRVKHGKVKDRQKRMGGTKAIRIDEEGDARLEDITQSEPPPDVRKKRKDNTDWCLFILFLRL
ncbi:hypothetical protein L1887_16020 [Cichorium endivia]|nr:hypothetical protein L1887_16020 [Cichorium endivia]